MELMAAMDCQVLLDLGVPGVHRVRLVPLALLESLEMEV